MAETSNVEMIFHGTIFWSIILYYLIINLVMAGFMAHDKKCSMDKEKKRRRVPEKNLYMLAIFGGGIGGLISMSYFRHKTRHIDFAIAYTVTAILHILVVYLLMGKFVFEFPI